MLAGPTSRWMQARVYASRVCDTVLNLDFAALVFGPDNSRGCHGDDCGPRVIPVLGLQWSLKTPELLRVDGRVSLSKSNAGQNVFIGLLRPLI